MHNIGKEIVLALEEKFKIETFHECGMYLHKIAEKTGGHRKTNASFFDIKKHIERTSKAAIIVLLPKQTGGPLEELPSPTTPWRKFKKKQVLKLANQLFKE